MCRPTSHHRCYHTSSRISLTPSQHRRGFYSHLFYFVFVLTATWVTWAQSGMGHVWPIYPTLGWGIGMISHYFGVRQHLQRFSGPSRSRRPDPEMPRSYREDWGSQWVEVHER
jgi:hypothetical protein